MSHYERLVNDMLGADEHLMRDSRRRRLVGAFRFSPIAPERAQWTTRERAAMIEDYRSLEDECLAVGTTLEEMNGKETVTYEDYAAATEIVRVFQQRYIERTCHYVTYRQWFTPAHEQAHTRLGICSDAITAYLRHLMRRVFP